MTNFMKDNTALSAAKTNFQARPGIPAGQKVTDVDWNEHRTTLLDIRAWFAGDVGEITLLTGGLKLSKNPNGDATSFHGRMTIPSAIAGKAPHSIDSTKQTFNGTPDPVVSFGYNQLASGAVQQAGEPGILLGIEGDYNDGTVRWLEAYVQSIGSDGVTQRRPWYAKVNRATNACVIDIQGNPVTFIDETNAVAMTVQVADVVVRNTFHVGSASTNGVFAIHNTTSEGRIRITGGSKELLQIGNISGITKVQIGPSAISGTGELELTSTAATLTTSLRINGTSGFNNTAPISKPTVTGSRGGNAALASLLTALSNYGLVTDSSTA